MISLFNKSNYLPILCRTIVDGRQAIILNSSHLELPKSLVARSRRQLSSRNEPKKTCLYDFHQAKKARMEMFAGYSMPIVYRGQTIKSEHMQTRQLASVFDVSHMMQTIVRGQDRVKFLEQLTVGDIESLALNKCSLSVITNQLGGIIDDCVIGKCKDHIQVVSNAANSEKVWNLLIESQRQNSNLNVQLNRLTGQGLIALQGPKAAQVLQQQLTDFELDKLKFMSTVDVDIDGIGKCTVTRCGYTGEDGFEVSVQPDASVALMEKLCNNELVKPAGLGARDTLRLEAGLCLHGHDINDTTTPVEAALNWVVQKRRRLDGNFPGAERIIEQLKSGTKIKRVGLIAKNEGGPPAREGSEVLGRAGTKLGRVTSGNYSPVLNRNIAMAYLPTDSVKQLGKIVFCTVRGKEFEYLISEIPFVKTNYYI